MKGIEEISDRFTKPQENSIPSKESSGSLKNTLIAENIKTDLIKNSKESEEISNLNENNSEDDSSDSKEGSENLDKANHSKTSKDSSDSEDDSEDSESENDKISKVTTDLSKQNPKDDSSDSDSSDSSEDSNDSEEDSDNVSRTFFNSKRLGNCEVCGAKAARYTCPKCEVKTCCLDCVKIHKKELDCDGIRDRTKYIPLKKITENDFKSDYYFLEECTRYVADRKQDRRKFLTFQNKNLPNYLFQLRKACRERKIRINFLLPHFTRRKENSTFHNWKEKKIFWHIEWIFINAGNAKYVDKRCDENKTLQELLDKYLNPNSTEDVPKKGLLSFYHGHDVNDIKILLKAEHVKCSKTRFFSLDLCKTLKENLQSKTIIEFPIIYITYDANLEGFDIIDSDEDVEEETKQHQKNIEEIRKEVLEKERNLKENLDNVEEEEKESEKVSKMVAERLREERKRKLEEYETKPQNYLFSDNNLLETLMSSSEDEEPEEKKLKEST